MFKACIFDLDGVLVDTAKYHFLAWKRLADELNIQFTEKDNERLKGVSRMRSLEIILEIGQVTLTEQEKADMAAKKNEWYVDYISHMNHNEILPGVEDFLNWLKEMQIKIALGSASKNTPLILERTGLLKYFDAIVDGNDVSAAKPDPEVFLLGAKKLGLMPQSCLVFEDAQAGIEAALAGDMKVVAVGHSDDLKGGTYYISTFLDKAEALKQFVLENC